MFNTHNTWPRKIAGGFDTEEIQPEMMAQAFSGDELDTDVKFLQIDS